MTNDTTEARVCRLCEAPCSVDDSDWIGGIAPPYIYEHWSISSCLAAQRAEIARLNEVAMHRWSMLQKEDAAAAAVEAERDELRAQLEAAKVDAEQMRKYREFWIRCWNATAGFRPGLDRCDNEWLRNMSIACGLIEDAAMKERTP